MKELVVEIAGNVAPSAMRRQLADDMAAANTAAMTMPAMTGLSVLMAREANTPS
jgi:hypothetical protein